MIRAGAPANGRFHHPATKTYVWKGGERLGRATGVGGGGGGRGGVRVSYSATAWGNSFAAFGCGEGDKDYWLYGGEGTVGLLED